MLPPFILNALGPIVQVLEPVDLAGEAVLAKVELTLARTIPDDQLVRVLDEVALRRLLALGLAGVDVVGVGPGELVQLARQCLLAQSRQLRLQLSSEMVVQLVLVLEVDFQPFPARLRHFDGFPGEDLSLDVSHVFVLQASERLEQHERLVEELLDHDQVKLFVQLLDEVVNIHFRHMLVHVKAEVIQLTSLNNPFPNNVHLYYSSKVAI